MILLRIFLVAVLTSISFFANAQLAKKMSDAELLNTLQWAPVKGERLEEIDTHIRRGLYTAFEERSRETVDTLIMYRAQQCPSAPQKCLNVDTWAKSACGTAVGEEVFTLASLWQSAFSAIDSEASARTMLKKIQSCANTPNTAQLVAALNLVQALEMKRITKASKDASSWIQVRFKTMPKPADRAVLALSEALRAMYPIHPLPMERLAGLSDVGVAWLKQQSTLEQDADSLIALTEAVVRVKGMAGLKSQVPPLVETNEKVYAKSPSGRVANIASEYCWAVRMLKHPEKCDQFLAKAFSSGSFSLDLEVFRINNDFELGNLDSAQERLANVTKKAKGTMVEPWLELNAAFLLIYNGDFEAARKHLKTFRKKVGTLPLYLAMDPHYAEIKVLRHQGDFIGAGKYIQEVRTTLEQGVNGPFIHRLLLEFEALLVALATKDTNNVEGSVKRLRDQMISDPAFDFYRFAADAVEKQLKKENPASALASMAGVKGASSPFYKEFETLLKASSVVQ